MGDLPKGGGSVALAHHNMLVEALARSITTPKLRKKGKHTHLLNTKKPLNCDSYVENNEMSVFNKPPIHAYQFYFFKEDSILTLSWDLIIFKYSETFEYVPFPVQSILGKRITTSQLWKEF